MPAVCAIGEAVPCELGIQQEDSGAAGADGADGAATATAPRSCESSHGRAARAVAELVAAATGPDLGGVA